MIRPVEINDAEKICEIYNFYIKNTTISFEEKTISVGDMKERISRYTKSMPWIVVEEKEELVGYAYSNVWKSRNAYRYTAEGSIYLKANRRGHGTGVMLYGHLLELLKEKGIHTVIGVISLPNERSVQLHEKLGFEKVAHFKEVGYKFDKWIDVGYWQYKI